MIQFFRRMFSSKIGVIVAILFVAMIGLAFGLADINAPSGMFSSSGDELATVDGDPVEEADVQQLMNRALANAREQQPGIDMAAFVDSGGLDQAIEQFTSAVALSAYAGEIDILIGKQLIDQTIADTPAFQGLSGQFDDATFRQVLQQQNLTEAEVRRDFERQLQLRLILGPAAAVAQAPESVVRPYGQLLLERRSGQVIAVPSAAVDQGAAPSRADINRFYQSHLRRYTLPERRSIRYASFTRSQIPVPTPTEAQIREYYAAHDDEYGGSEIRGLRQIILPSEEQAQAFYNEVKGGKSFEAAASARGFTAGSTEVDAASEPDFANGTSDAVARAAYAAGQGDLTRPARSGLGWHVIQVESVSAQAARPIAQVRGEIVSALSRQLADDALANFYLAIENAIDDGSSFEEVVDAQGLTIEVTPLVAPNGQSPDDANFSPGRDMPALLEAAFSMEEDEDPILVPLEENQRYALVDVTEVARSAPQPLASITPIVTRHFIRDRASRRARQVATRIARQINQGKTPAEAIAATGVTLPAPQIAEGTRQQMARMENPPAPLRLMFRMAPDTAKLIQLPSDQGWFVVALHEIESNVEELTPQILAATQSQFGEILANEYAEQFVNAVLAEHPVERNDDAIQAFSNRLTGRSQ